MRYKHLTQEQRRSLVKLRQEQRSHRFIADRLGVHSSTISRELKRNGTSRGYTAKGSHEMAMDRRRDRYAQTKKIKGVLEIIVRDRLCSGWSPEQISGRLKIECRGDLSVECIYRYVIRDRRDGGKLYESLRRRGRSRQRRHGRRSRFIVIPEPRRELRERCFEAQHRVECGHWERDLMLGRREGGAAVLTMVDRTSRYTVLERVENRSSDHVAWATVEAFRSRGLEVRTLSNDRGVEFGRPSVLERELKVPVYFARAYASWERGTVENTIGLVRQYFPKGCDLKEVQQEVLDRVQQEINQRPRKMHGYLSAEEIHFKKNLRMIRSDEYYRKKNYQESMRDLYLLDLSLQLPAALAL